MIIGERSEAVGCVVEPMDFMLSGLYRLLLKSVLLVLSTITYTVCLLVSYSVASLFLSIIFHARQLPIRLKQALRECDPSLPS